MGIRNSLAASKIAINPNAMVNFKRHKWVNMAYIW
jgi:hypothetical protein